MELVWDAHLVVVEGSRVLAHLEGVKAEVAVTVAAVEALLVREGLADADEGEDLPSTPPSTTQHPTQSGRLRSAHEKITMARQDASHVRMNVGRKWLGESTATPPLRRRTCRPAGRPAGRQAGRHTR
jgi:hypothetical protein